MQVTISVDVGCRLVAQAALVLAILALIPGTAAAETTSCERAIHAAETAHGLPRGLLKAMGWVESRHRPFAIQAGGKSYYPESRQAAATIIRDLKSNGHRFIDVGCVQINLAYHGDRIGLDALLDAEANASYGAGFLKGLYRRERSWRRAVARYHASDQRAQSRYLAAVGSRLRSQGRSIVGFGSSFGAGTSPALQALLLLNRRNADGGTQRRDRSSLLFSIYGGRRRAAETEQADADTDP